MQTFVDKVEAEFTLTTHQLIALKNSFSDRLQRGLVQNHEMLKCLPTFVRFLPTGNEVGKFLTVDLGGTNLRVGLVELLGSGRFEIRKEACAIPDDLKSANNGRKIFAFIAERIESFLQKPEIEAQLPLQLGFTFSFPVEQKSLAHGKILGWSKEIVADDVIGLDAVEFLQEELHARELEIKVGSLVNDTVGTLLAQVYADDRTKISVILGTGSNAAYVENQENILKIGKTEPGLTVVNIEWGSFGDGEESLLPVTRFDAALDAQSKNRSKQRFEKMMSGMYLGEIVRLFLVEAQERGLIESFDDPSPYHLKTKSVSQFLESPSTESLFQLLNVKSQNVDEIGRICRAVANRSALLCAAGIAAIYERIVKEKILKKNEFCIVAVDGALYRRFHRYKELLQETVCQLTTDGGSELCKIELVMAEDLSSIGAAAAIGAIPK